MANPRYPQQPRDPKLEKLALLAQLLPALQGPQIQQGAQDQNLLLGLLGMGVQSDERAADREQRNMDSQAQTNNMFAQLGIQNSHNQQQLEQQAAMHKATLDQQGMAMAAQANQAAAHLGMQNSLADREATQRAESEKAASRDRQLAILGQMPGQTPSSFLKQAELLGAPGADKAVAGMQEAVTQQNVQQLLATLGPVYSGFDKDPRAAQTALDTLWQADPRLQDPMIQSAMQPHLDRLNAGVTPPAAPGINGSQPPSSTVPGTVGQLYGSELGDLGSGIANATSMIRNYTSVPIWNFLAGLTGMKQQQPIPYQ